MRTLQELVDSSAGMTPQQQRIWYATLPREEQKTLEVEWLLQPKQND